MPCCCCCCCRPEKDEKQKKKEERHSTATPAETDVDAEPSVPSVPSAASANRLRNSTIFSGDGGGESARLLGSDGGPGTPETVQSVTRQGDVLFAGFLRKMKVGKNWKTRWCVLTDQRLTYFRAKHGDNEKPQGHIDLSGAAIEETVEGGIIDETDPEFQHAFAIKPRGNGANFVFAAMSDSEKEVWLVAFCKAARCEPPARLSTSTSLSSIESTSDFGEDDVPMSPVEIFASLCCFRVQQRFIHRVLRQEKQRTFGMSSVALEGEAQSVGWDAVPSVAGWPVMAGWLDKKGRTTKGWKPRWVVVVGPFLTYYESPGEHFAGRLLKGEEGFIYLGDFELLDHSELAGLTSASRSPTSSRSFSNAEKTAVTQHQNCVAIASRLSESKWYSNPLLLELGTGSEHTIDEWAGALRQAILLAGQFPSQEAAVTALVEASTMRHLPSEKPHRIVADASLIPAFGSCGVQDQRRMLTHLEQMITFAASTTKEELELAQWQRQLVRFGWLSGVDLGARSDGKEHRVMVFLLENMLLVVQPHGVKDPASELHEKLEYRQHQLLKESTDVSDLSSLAFMVSTGSRSYRFSAPDERSKQLWLRDLYGLLRRQTTMHNMLDRYLGAVIFADVSGFSNLGDALERREHQEQEAAKKAGGKLTATGAPTAAEELARILGKEIEQMVEDVTRGGGDVIKFAGDCVIAVFPAEQYMDLPKTSEYGSLALATGQAVRVSIQMMHAKNMFLLKSQQHRQQYGDDDEISRLVSALNIHIAIGAGEVFGYHVGGVQSKWDYLISGPVMEQVRSADSDSGAGEVVLSKEAFELLKRIKMRKTFLKSGNVKLETYFGPTEEPPFRRPWEAFKDKPELCDQLAKYLSLYVPKPVVSQVEAGNTLWLAAKKQISTIFCRLIGIDYVSRQGQKAVTQLGEIITQVQTILVSDQGTLTRVISDDKGTSMLMAFSHPQHAVNAAMSITTAVEAIPVPPDEPRFRTAIGITTGVVFYGPVGGRIRAEHTMHGSVVNFSARLMTCPLIKNSGGILCDEATAKLASRTEFVAQAPRHFKGFEDDVVSYMPTRRVAAPAAVLSTTGNAQTGSTQANHDLEHELKEFESDALQVESAPSTIDWVSRLEPTLTSTISKGCVIAVETDFPGHWNLGAIKDAVASHIPTVQNVNLVFNDQDQALNSNQLRQQLKTVPPADTCLILEKANVLDDANWQLLFELCQNVRAEEQAVTSAARRILVLTLDPMHAGKSTKWYDKLVAEQQTIYEKVHAGFVCAGDASALTVPEEITLEIAAVLAAGTVASPASHMKPYFNRDLLMATHPYINMKIAGWSEDTVQMHLESLLDSKILRSKTPAEQQMPTAESVPEYEFDDVAVQVARYRSVLHEHRLPIHVAALAWLESKLDGLESSSDEDPIRAALYGQLHFHCLCAGETERAQCYATVASNGADKQSHGDNRADTMKIVTRRQNERRFMGGYAAVNLLPTDRPPWCDSSGVASTRNEASLPKGDNTHVWQWTSEWVVNINPNETDEDGWRYGERFGSPTGECAADGWGRLQSAAKVVRSREWIRVAMKVPIGKRRRTTTISSTEGRLIAAQLRSRTLDIIAESEATTGGAAADLSSVPPEQTTETRIATLEEENARLQATIEQLQASSAARTSAADSAEIGVPKEVSHDAVQPVTDVPTTKAPRPDMWNKMAAEVLATVRHAHPVATGVAAHKARAAWYQSVRRKLEAAHPTFVDSQIHSIASVITSENDFSSASSELLSALTALQAWSAGEQAALSQELAAMLAQAAAPTDSTTPAEDPAAEVANAPQTAEPDTLDSIPVVPHMDSVRPLNRAAPARLAASLSDGSFPALPSLPDATDNDGVAIEYFSDSSSDDHDA